MLFSCPVERTRFRQQHQLILADRRHAALQVVFGNERPGRLTCQRDRVSNRLPQPLHITQTHSHGKRVAVLFSFGFVQLLQRAVPVGTLYVDGPHLEAVPLGIVDECRWAVETHRLIVEQRTQIRGQVMKLRVRARIRDTRKRMSVRFGEHELAHRREDTHHLRLLRRVEAVGCHPVDQPRLEAGEYSIRPFAAHRLAQLLGFAACEVRRNHAYSHDLFLKQRHAQRALEEGLE